MRVRKAKPGKTPAKPTKKSPLPRQREASQEEQLRMLMQEAELLRLKTQGYTRAEIAKELGIDTATVHRMWERSFAEFITDHRKLRDEKFAEMLAGHENMIRVWSDKAKTEEKAAIIVLRARREISRMCSHGNTAVIEHQGAGGGPIVTVNATPQDAAALVRARFNGIEPYVAKDEDGSLPDTAH